jgi:hypothetical protein
VRRRIAADEEILAAIVDLADDGFCDRRELGLRYFPGVGERDLRKSLGRANRRGLILERRALNGRFYIALTSEGWDLIRSTKARA